MTWEKFITIWETEINISIPQKAASAWYRFVGAANDAILERAVANVSDAYAAERKRRDFVPNPTLADLKRAYNEESTAAAREIKSVAVHCAFCESTGTVCLLDDGRYGPDWPQDPATYTGRRAVCVAPCPVCHSDDYGDPGKRERIKRFCRPHSRRYELLNRRAAE